MTLADLGKADTALRGALVAIAAVASLVAAAWGIEAHFVTRREFEVIQSELTLIRAELSEIRRWQEAR